LIIFTSSSVFRALILLRWLVKADRDRLLVTVQSEACIECGEPYYSADTLRHFERVREEFARKEIAGRLVGNVYELL
jgi:hypothetical protein